MADARRRIPRRLDHHLEPARSDQRLGVLAKMGGAASTRLVERRRRESFLGPARKRQAFSGAIKVEIGDAKDVQAGRQTRLGEEHGAELAGADETGRNRPPFGLALTQQAMEVHGPNPFPFRIKAGDDSTNDGRNGSKPVKRSRPSEAHAIATGAIIRSRRGRRVETEAGSAVAPARSRKR